MLLRKIERASRIAVASLLLLGSGEALATTVSFADTTKYWPGYANGTADDAKDTIGTPDFTGGSAVFDDATGRLTGLSFSYTGKFSPVASGDARVIPGDILLDLGSDGHWDFVIKLVAGPQTPVADYSSLSILDVHDIASPSYLLSGSDNTGYWHGYGIRDQHPYAWAGGGTVVGTASLGAFDQLASGGTLHLDLRSGLPTNPSLTIGFAPSCANDVVLAKIAAPVPEPTAALVFGVGLAAVACERRRPREPRSRTHGRS